jgi:hypothetical protein
MFIALLIPVLLPANRQNYYLERFGVKNAKWCIRVLSYPNRQKSNYFVSITQNGD